MLAKICIFGIRIYQITLSPDKWIPSLWLKWKICCHEPHCSQYWINTLNRYWFFKWIFKVMDRVAHCTWSNCKIYDPEYYKVIFFSSSPIGITFLDELVQNSKFEVVWVVTMPDVAQWRGMKYQENIIKTHAKKLWISEDFIKTPPKINPDKTESGKEFFEWLKSIKPDFFVVIAYWKIIPQVVLDIPYFGAINVHGSLLPEYRGASPLQSVFLDKKDKTWLTIMKMDSQMDTGNMIDKMQINMPFERTVLDLVDYIKIYWPKFLSNTLRKYAKKMLWEVQQNNQKATCCQKISKSDWEIMPFVDSLDEVYAKYRAFFMWPKIYFLIQENNLVKFNSKHFNKRVVIEKIVLDQNKYLESNKKPIFIWKSLNSAVLEILVKPEGWKLMDWNSFLNWFLEL